MSELRTFILMLTRANIYHDTERVTDAHYEKAHIMVRVPAGPDTKETRRLQDWNGYRGVSSCWYFDIHGALVGTGAFE